MRKLNCLISMAVVLLVTALPRIATACGPYTDTGTFDVTVVQRSPTWGPKENPVPGGTYNLGITQRGHTYRVVVKTDESTVLTLSHAAVANGGIFTGDPTVVVSTAGGCSTHTFSLKVRNETVPLTYWIQSKITVSDSVNTMQFDVQTREIEYD
ncbi:hypothetical protein Pan97_00730 [Bremerella volcania]|uniref:Uncharacterized protein n=1 Tax=Bremerella volcania TaxID=2527984 RepID=A0A518C1K7_9BACT|nr:hypothetical protein [Bremerella volcania]QDU73106.1 hypothetical protein Pan97_00730 [Bremerella volcania]